MRAGLAQTGAQSAAAAAGRPLKVLFLGQDQATHPAAGIYQAIGAPLARKGIQLTPVLSPAALSAERLPFYDAILIYGNHTALAPDQEKAPDGFRRERQGRRRAALGLGDVRRIRAIHHACALGGLIGAQPQRQGTGSEFTAEIVQSSHPAMQGVQPFATWDETVVLTKQNPTGRTVLMERVDGTGRTPWTWVRNQGKGRVFYTAYGHDQRTWNNPGFQTLVERAIVWSVPEAARQAFQQLKMPPVNYADGMNVPNYENRDPAPEVPAAIRGRRGNEVRPDPGRVLAQPVRHRARHRQADHVCVRRARPDVDRRNSGLPERTDGRQTRRRSHPHPRGHQRRRQGGQVHGVRRSAQHPDEPRVRQRRRDRGAAAAHPVPQGHQRRRQGRRAEDSEHGLGAAGHARGAFQPPVRDGQLHLGRRRLLRLQGRDQRQAVRVRPGGLPLQARRQ